MITIFISGSSTTQPPDGIGWCIINLILSWIPYRVTLKENFPVDLVPDHVKSHRRLPCSQHGCPDGVVVITLD